MRIILRAIFPVLKMYLSASLMMFPTAKGIDYAAQGNIFPATALLASGLVGAIVVNLRIKKELDQ
ncbi:hypothetical protein ACL1FY_04130 [Corynebacterium striatum]